VATSVARRKRADLADDRRTDAATAAAIRIGAAGTADTVATQRCRARARRCVDALVRGHVASVASASAVVVAVRISGALDAAAACGVAGETGAAARVVWRVAALTTHAFIGRTGDQVVTIRIRAAGIAARAIRAAFAAACAGTERAVAVHALAGAGFARVVTRALRVSHTLRGLDATRRHIASEAGFAGDLIVRVRARARSAGVFRAIDLVVTVGRRAARAARSRSLVRVRTTRGGRAVRGAQLRMLALARVALVDGAWLAVVALRVFAALRATKARTTQHSRAAVFRRVFTEHVRARRDHTGIIAVAITVDGARFLLLATVRNGAVLVCSAVLVVRSVRAGAGEAIVIRAAHAVVAIRFRTAFAALPVTALFGRVALGRAFAQAVGTTLIDRARVAVVAIFRAGAGFRRLDRTVTTTAAARVTRDASIGSAGASRGREFRAPAGIRSERAQNEQEAGAEPVADAASIHG